MEVKLKIREKERKKTTKNKEDYQIRKRRKEDKRNQARKNE